MIEETAQVLRLHDRMAEVVTQRQSACGHCAAKNGCGTSLLATWFPQRQLVFRLNNDIHAAAGDTVIIGLDEAFLQRSSLLLYALPLLGLLVGAVAGEYGFSLLEWPTELGAILSGLLGLSAALVAVRHISAGSFERGDAGVKLLRISRSSMPGNVGFHVAHVACEIRKQE